MKKLLCAAFAVLVLAGCSGGAKTETKTCSMEQSGMKMDATFTAEDDKITKTATVDVDMKDGDSATLKKLGFGGEASLSKTLEEAKDGGATCK